eukprot:277248-Alexandrium_andersonii.AAC.1
MTETSKGFGCSRSQKWRRCRRAGVEKRQPVASPMAKGKDSDRQGKPDRIGTGDSGEAFAA